MTLPLFIVTVILTESEIKLALKDLARIHRLVAVATLPLEVTVNKVRHTAPGLDADYLHSAAPTPETHEREVLDTHLNKSAAFLRKKSNGVCMDVFKYLWSVIKEAVGYRHVSSLKIGSLLVSEKPRCRVLDEFLDILRTVKAHYVAVSTLSENYRAEKSGMSTE